MPSPFPGMNPYLERAGVWEMFHTQLLSAFQQHLTAQVRPNYRVRLETRVTVHEPAGRREGVRELDLAVGLTGGRPAATGPATATLAPPAYVTEPGWLEIERSRYLEIRDRLGREVVTVLELLSPSNKYAGPDREQYLAKRREVLRSRSHFVEIDLLRGGPRMPPDDLPTCDYCAIVSRVGERPRAGVWPWALRDPMPQLPIPLRAPDADAVLPLKALLDQIYDAGGYGDEIYGGPPEPRLAPDDLAWAAEFLPPQA